MQLFNYSTIVHFILFVLYNPGQVQQVDLFLDYALSFPRLLLLKICVLQLISGFYSTRSSIERIYTYILNKETV